MARTKSPLRAKMIAESKARAEELRNSPLLDTSKPITSLSQAEFERIKASASRAKLGKRWGGVLQ